MKATIREDNRKSYESKRLVSIYIIYNDRNGMNVWWRYKN